MGLLTDFYNTVARFFRPQEVSEEDSSKTVATNRLKLVLMQDRTNLTPKILEQMRGELVDLLSKYLEMDKELLELNFEQEGDQVALMLSIPVIRAKDEEEIEAAIKEAASKADIDENDSEECEEDDEAVSEGESDSSDEVEDDETESDGQDSDSEDDSEEITSDEIEVKEMKEAEETDAVKPSKKG